MAFDNLPEIPDVPSTGVQEQDEFFRAVKENLEKMQGKDPSNTIDDRVLTELEVGARTSRDWPQAFIYDASAAVHYFSATYQTLPWTTVATDIVLTNPAWGDYSLWVPDDDGLVVIPEDGRWEVNVNLLFWYGSTITDTSVYYINMHTLDPTKDDSGFPTSTTTWDLVSRTILRNDTTGNSLLNYANPHKTNVLNLKKGHKIGINFAQTSGTVVGSPNGAFLNNGAWCSIQLTKIAESGLIEDPGGGLSTASGKEYQNWIRSTHERPDRQRKETR